MHKKKAFNQGHLQKRKSHNLYKRLCSVIIRDSIISLLIKEVAVPI
jgi:hypothetical protein